MGHASDRQYTILLPLIKLWISLLSQITSYIGKITMSLKIEMELYRIRIGLEALVLVLNRNYFLCLLFRLWRVTVDDYVPRSIAHNSYILLVMIAVTINSESNKNDGRVKTAAINRTTVIVSLLAAICAIADSNSGGRTLNPKSP